jgi:hypothetical protein
VSFSRDSVKNDAQFGQLVGVVPDGDPKPAAAPGTGQAGVARVGDGQALALALAWIAPPAAALAAFSGDSGERLLALPPSC